MARRLIASRPLFVAPTGLRHLPRLRPHTLVSIFIRVGLATTSLHRSPPFGLAHYYPRQNRSSTSQRSSAFRNRSSPMHAFGIFLALVSFLISIFFRAVRIHPVLTLPPSSPSTMPSASYRPFSATSKLAPPASSPDSCELSVPTWQYYYSSLSLPFCPTLCSCPPPHNCALPPTHTSASARTPPRYPCHRTCTDETLANTRAPHFTPQHGLLCHMGLY